jgi:hypothetical protein
MSKTKRMAVDAIDGPVTSDKGNQLSWYHLQAEGQFIQVFMPLIVSYLPFGS